MNVYCIKHPKYTGNSAPDLKCKFCCHVFVQKVRDKQQLEIDKLKEQFQQKERNSNGTII